MLLLGAQLYRALLKEARNLPDLHLRSVAVTSASCDTHQTLTLVFRSDYYRETIRSAFRRDDVYAESSQRAVRRVAQAQKVGSFPNLSALAATR